MPWWGDYMSYCRKHNVEFTTHCLTCTMEAEAAAKPFGWEVGE